MFRRSNDFYAVTFDIGIPIFFTTPKVLICASVPSCLYDKGDLTLVTVGPMRCSGVALVFLCTYWSLLVRSGSCFVAYRSTAKLLPRTHKNAPTPAAEVHLRAVYYERRDTVLPLRASNSWLSQFWPQKTTTDKESNTKIAKVAALKQNLLEAVRGTERGVSTTAEQRENIDRLIAALEPFNPNANFVTSETLSALWILEWTTEREIIFLMEKGLLGLPSGPVQQAIDVDAKTLSNIMLFGQDSKFEVYSSITPEDAGPRVNFEFEACKLKYRGFTVPLPPVGKGWFESVYLDEDFQVTRDVRGDVTVLVKGQA